jgi:hypothetical protein
MYLMFELICFKDTMEKLTDCVGGKGVLREKRAEKI